MAEPKDEDIVMVGDGLEEGDQPEVEKKVAAKPEETDDDAEDGDEPEKKGEGEDKRVAHAEGEQEGEDAEQATRRQERKQRKERQRAARAAAEAELRYYRKRTEDLEKRFSHLEKRTRGTEAATIDSRIASLKSQIEAAKKVEAKAISDNEGDDAVEAREIREELETGLQRLESARERVVKEPVVDDREPPPNVKLAMAWIDKHKSWYDPSGKDEDSAIAASIENHMLRSGGNPASPEYWEELDRRLKKHLPHRFKATKDDEDEDEDDDGEDEAPTQQRQSKDNGSRQQTPPRKSGGPRVSVGGRERPLKPNEVYISPERKATMIEAGVWEDPVRRARMLKQYRQWDRENPKS